MRSNPVLNDQKLWGWKIYLKKKTYFIWYLLLKVFLSNNTRNLQYMSDINPKRNKSISLHQFCDVKHKMSKTQSRLFLWNGGMRQNPKIIFSSYWSYHLAHNPHIMTCVFVFVWFFFFNCTKSIWTYRSYISFWIDAQQHKQKLKTAYRWLSICLTGKSEEKKYCGLEQLNTINTMTF